MAFFTRLYAIILLAIITVVAASPLSSKFLDLVTHPCLISSTDVHFHLDLDAFEEFHHDSAEGPVVYGRMSVWCI